MTAPSPPGHTHPPAPHPAGPRLDAVRRTIADACARAGRDPATVTLVAASKTVPATAIGEVVEAGQLVYGENRVQEARAKWPALRARYPQVELHLIGPLQSNKVREAVALFDAIHSVDRPALARALAAECARQHRYPELFVQVNTGAEAQKSGVAVDAVDGLLAAAAQEAGLRITGLMCVPPVHEPPEPHFALLAEIAARHRLERLSMGMSTDFATAVEYGATHVRVGSALFGARPGPVDGSRR